ncbi:nucleotidyltransferase domain-containing protein [Agrobacterium tumefaciens]|uniref:nucleotidyltransferase domain-containing protein n=1 Tax=Agrobacterium tumefaciens TaxID=358 RepID=UPI003AF88D7C
MVAHQMLPTRPPNRLKLASTNGANFLAVLTADEIVELANQLLEDSGIDAHVSVFGSHVTDPRRSIDIDLLVVLRTSRDRVDTRKALSELLLTLPVHLYLMDREEEEELDFRNRSANWSKAST